MARNLSPEAAANQRAAQNAWHRQNLDRISVTVPKGMREEYSRIAAERGTSLNRLINEYLESLL